jgi:hypothetical protein
MIPPLRGSETSSGCDAPFPAAPNERSDSSVMSLASTNDSRTATGNRGKRKQKDDKLTGDGRGGGNSDYEIFGNDNTSPREENSETDDDTFDPTYVDSASDVSTSCSEGDWDGESRGTGGKYRSMKRRDRERNDHSRRRSKRGASGRTGLASTSPHLTIFLMNPAPPASVHRRTRRSTNPGRTFPSTSASKVSPTTQPKTSGPSGMVPPMPLPPGPLTTQFQVHLSPPTTQEELVTSPPVVIRFRIHPVPRTPSAVLEPKVREDRATLTPLASLGSFFFDEKWGKIFVSTLIHWAATLEDPFRANAIMIPVVKGILKYTRPEISLNDDYGNTSEAVDIAVDMVRHYVCRTMVRRCYICSAMPHFRLDRC